MRMKSLTLSLPCKHVIVLETSSAASSNYLSSHLQFGTHDVVVLKPNKADIGSPALGQGVVYRLKVFLTLRQNFGWLYFSVLVLP